MTAPRVELDGEVMGPRCLAVLLRKRAAARGLPGELGRETRDAVRRHCLCAEHRAERGEVREVREVRDVLERGVNS